LLALSLSEKFLDLSLQPCKENSHRKQTAKKGIGTPPNKNCSEEIPGEMLIYKNFWSSHAFG
jgi:hypothetical protein